MKASDVMSRNVVSARPDMPVAAAIGLMLDKGISGLPVVESDGSVVGILTEGDLLRRSETDTQKRRPRWLELLLGPGRLASEYVRTHGRLVGELMTREVVAVTEETPLDEVVRLMEENRIKRLPVRRGDTLVGIVSRADLLRALRQSIASVPAVEGDDAIRERVLAEIVRSAWAPREGISVSVADGIVDIGGVVFDEKQREAMIVAAENVPGVKAVNDHLVWVEPVSGVVIEPSEAPGAGERKGR
jgi:CBS domain-containing protein